MPKVMHVNSTEARISAENGTAVYIGRPSIWGNPFRIGVDGDRGQVIAKYEAWLSLQPSMLVKVKELAGKDLLCWCSPQHCHGDVLLRIANQK